MATFPTRTEKRRGFDMNTRIALAETDLDEQENALVAVVEEQKKGNRLLQQILVALATGALLLALDLITRGVSG